MVLIFLFCFWFIQGEERPTESQSATYAQAQSSPSVSGPSPSQNTRPAGSESGQKQGNTQNWSDPLVVLQILLFAAVAAQAAIYVWQAILMRRAWRSTRESVDLSRESFLQTVQMDTVRVQDSAAQYKMMHLQAQAMEIQSGVMLGQLDAMKKQSEMAEASLEETRKLVTQNERAVKVAERSVEVAQENTIYAQRAYVTVPSGSVMLSDEGTALFSLKLLNSGNTPANEVRMFAVVEVRTDAPPTIDFREAVWVTLGVIAPRESATRLVANKSDLSKADAKLMQERKVSLYVWGAIEYRDVFKETPVRQTKFCFAQRFGISRIGSCAGNNEAS